MSDELSLLSEYAGELANGWQSLPAPVQRNFLKAVGTIITGLADVPASYLEMKAAEFKVKKRGHEMIMTAVAKNAAKVANKSPELAERALHYFASDLIREQENREAVMKQALIAADNLPPPASSEQIPDIDDDWLHQFRNLAASKSNTEIQSIFGRILAGEIYKPGSFSPMTLEVVARLDQRTAQMFEAIANHTIITPGQWDTLVTSVLGEDGLKHVQLLNPSILMHLESVGLITTVGVRFINPEGFAKMPPSTFGGQKVIMSECAAMPRPNMVIGFKHGNAAYLSQAGGELQSIITKSFDSGYAKNLRDGLRRSGIELTFPDVDIDAVAA